MVDLDLSGGISVSISLTYGSLTQLQQALAFELFRWMREASLFPFDEIPLETYIPGRSVQTIDLIPLMTVHGANEVTFTSEGRRALVSIRL